MNERELTSELIGFESDRPEGVRLAAGFVAGWLESQGVGVEQTEVRGLPVLMAETGPAGDDAPTIVLHGHLDVVPGREGQFIPELVGDKLFGRGAYDMKGALAAMMLAVADLADQDQVRVRLGVVPDEEREEETDRGSDKLVDAGFLGDFVVTGEPTDMLIGIEAKGVLAMRVHVEGHAAHGSTPWLGDNAILRAIDVFRSVESLPFSRQSSELFDRPSINLGRILGGDALNKVPDSCVIDIDIRHLPEQEPAEILEQVKALEGVNVIETFTRPPVRTDPDNPYVIALGEAADPHTDEQVTSVGRDGASDAVSFIRAGVPAVEFGPVGEGHHGPSEWVSVSSLANYRRTLTDFITAVPDIPGGSA